MLISRTQQRELIGNQPKTKQRKMQKWVVKNTHSIMQTWEALEEMDDQTFQNFLAMVNVIAEQRKQS